MKTIPRALFLGSTLGLTACSTVTDFGKNSVAFVQKTSVATGAKVSQLSEMAVNRIAPPSVKVVQVREKDLKKLPTGEERALAFENTRKRRFWFFSGPVDFKEPTLPEAGGEMDGSLLPPREP